MDLAGTRAKYSPRVGRSARAAALLLLALAASGGLAAAGITCVSVSTDGVQADASSMSPAITPDGRYVAFVSDATNLVAGDTNSRRDVFRHDRETGVTERVSVSSSGVQANDGSGGAALSADGRYVAFYSSASNLVAGDTNGTSDIFVHDCATGHTTRVSVASDGTEGDGYSAYPAMSADGRYVAFCSNSTNLVANDTNATSDVFVHDAVTGETTRVNLTSYGMQSTGAIQYIDISADGRYVAFGSQASELVPGDANADWDVFVHDCETGATECVSVTSAGTSGNDGSMGSDAHFLSADGRYVTFTSDATNLVAGDTNNRSDAFVYDRQTHQMERVGITSAGLQAVDSSGVSSISADGSCVSFYSADDGLVPGDSNTWNDVYVHDRRTGRTERVSVGLGGVDSNGGSVWNALSADGRYVAFASSATNLITGGTSGLLENMFVCERPAAGFAADVTSGLVPLTVSFTDLSTGEPTFWSWDFGDGCDSGEQHPTHTYSAVGTYTVTLTAGGIYGSDTETKPDYISVTNESAPVADFSADTTAGLAPLRVAFTDLSTNDPTSWAWDFGDGNTSPMQHPSHIYAGGTFTVSLTASNAGGSDTETKTDYINSETTAVAAFSATPTIGTAPLNVAFTDESTGGIETWHWDFGDGGTSTTQSPTHQYTGVGSYDVSLTVTNAAGSDTEAKPDYIHVTTTVVAGFVASPTIGTVPLAVGFSDLSTGVIDSWLWDFGDSATSADPEPDHIFNGAGTYTVTLTVDNAGASDVEIKTRYILVTFVDVPFDPPYWALHQILACVDADIVQGYDQTTYAPAAAVSRDQMAVYIARALAGGDALVPTGPEVATFEDVPNTGYGTTGTDPYWAYRYIEYCVAHDVVRGYSATVYSPEDPVTRDQMAVFVARAKGWVGIDDDMTTAPEVFPDVPAGSWAGTAIEACVAQGVVQGYDDGLYHPGYAVARDQMAVYVARAFQLPM